VVDAAYTSLYQCLQLDRIPAIVLIIELEGLDVRQAVRMYVSHLVSSQTLSIHVLSRLHGERHADQPPFVPPLCIYG